MSKSVSQSRSFKDLPFQLCVAREPHINFAVWFVYYDSAICGTGLTPEEAIFQASVTLEAIGLISEQESQGIQSWITQRQGITVS